MKKGYLVLESGETFEGVYIGAEVETEGEVVFNTSMTGYQELLTDPSSKGQILAFTYPTIGSYGMNLLDNQSKGIAVSAVIMNDICDEPSHYQSTTSLSDQLKKANVPGLSHIDTRALVSIIRKKQTVRGKITTSINDVSDWKDKDTVGLVDDVSVSNTKTYGEGTYHVVLMDFGYKQSILKALLKADCKVTVVPYNTPFHVIESLDADGILISNGPGNPNALKQVLPTIKAITENYPTLGIALGHQLIALAYGGEVVKLPYGHRGNYPVKNMQTKKVYMTAQNHGYTVTDKSIDNASFQITYQQVNDKSVEGITHRHLPVQSVQFHPEANPGPSDTEFIFHDFIHQVKTSGGKKYVEAVK